MTDTSLLDKDGPITLKDLKKQFRANDFSTLTSNYKSKTATSEENEIYIKAKGFFCAAWEKEMKKLTGKGSLRNYSGDSPIRCLEEAEENLVAGTVMELLKNEEHCAALIEQIFDSMQEHITKEIEKFAATHNKPVDALTDEEFQQVLETFADEFLSRMMNLLQRVQEVKKLMKFMKKMPAAEDFDENVIKNRPKMDFLRKWNHTRSKVGNMLPLTEEMLEEVPGDFSGAASDAVELGLAPVATAEEVEQLLLMAFINSLNDEIDREIMYKRADGATQKEIAMALGYANHTPVTKRLKRLEKEFDVFMKKITGS